MRYFFLDFDSYRAPPDKGATVLLSAEESHHLFHVLRGKRDQRLHLTDGNGRFYHGVLLGKQGRCARVRIEAAWQDEQEAMPPQLALACAVVKGRRFAWALEKATEIGAHQIWPLSSERSVMQPGPGRQEHWSGVLRAATKQSGRSFQPRLHRPADLRSCLEAWDSGQVYYGDLETATDRTGGPAGDNAVFAADLLGEPRFDPATKPPDPPELLVWIVGPEGGWSESERRLLQVAGGRTVRLGPHRLRTETAAIAGLALLQSVRQRWCGAGLPAASGKPSDRSA